MRARIAAIAVIATLVSCNKPRAAQSHAGESDPFPQKGDYHVVHEMTQAGDTKREEYDVSLDLSDLGKFSKRLSKDDGTNCRDKQVSVGGGSFGVRMTCDAPDGDIHNIAITRQGTYSKDSIDMTMDMTVWGIQSRETFAFRLKAS